MQFTDEWLIPTIEPLLPPDTIASLRQEGGGTAGAVWDLLVARKLLTDTQILDSIAGRFRLRVAPEVVADASARDIVSEQLARRFNVLPLHLTDSYLEVATANPFDIDAEKMLAFATGREVRMLLAAPSSIRRGIGELFPSEDEVSKLLGGLESDAQVQQLEDDSDEGASADEASHAPIIRLVDMMLADGVVSRASDIHVEPVEGGFVVRYRIDGVLRQVMKIPRSAGLPLISRIKIMSGLDIADRRRPQDGRARVAVNGSPVDLRVSTLPASGGEKVVIRVLNAKATVLTLESLGMLEDERATHPVAAQQQGRHSPRDRAHRFGQDHHALLGASDGAERGRQYRHGRGSGRVQAGREHRAGAGAGEGRPHLRRGASLDSPAGP